MAELGADVPIDLGRMDGSSSPEKGVPGIDETAEGTIHLTVDTTTHPGRTLIDVGGELDMLTAPQLRDTLLHYVNTPDADVVISLDHVDFLASTGLGVLVEVAQHATSTGSTLRLVCASRTVLRPLELTGLDQVFDIYPTLTDLDA
jgi:anti-sigma B factor antagonist